MQKYAFTNHLTPPKGWQKLYQNAVTDIAALSPPADFLFTEIATEHGRLTVHFSHADDKADEIQAILDRLHSESASICQDCGKPGRFCASNDLNLTLCHDCFNLYYGDVSNPIEQIEEADTRARNWALWNIFR